MDEFLISCVEPLLVAGSPNVNCIQIMATTVISLRPTLQGLTSCWSLHLAKTHFRYSLLTSNKRWLLVGKYQPVLCMSIARARAMTYFVFEFNVLVQLLSSRALAFMFRAKELTI